MQGSVAISAFVFELSKEEMEWVSTFLPGPGLIAGLIEDIIFSSHEILPKPHDFAGNFTVLHFLQETSFLPKFLFATFLELFLKILFRLLNNAES